ncbi:MAG: anti-sigma factor family protein, partial [Pseudomonadota bacterium]
MNKQPGPHRPEIDDELLHRFVDGALDSRERLRVEALLSSDPEAFESVMAYQRQNVMLQALHARREDDVMLPPAALGLARRVRHVHQARRMAALSLGILVLVGTGAIGWQAKNYLPGEPTPVVSVFHQSPSAAASPNRQAPAVTPPGVRPVAQSPDAEAATLGPVALPSSRVAVHPPNLQTVGYQLVDGRADLTAYGPVIRFAYDPIDAKGARLSLTVAAFGADRQSLA